MCWKPGSFAFLYILVMISAAGCGDAAEDALASSPHANLAGTWDVTLTTTGGTQGPIGTQTPAMAEIVQRARVLSGTLTMPGGLSASLDGLVTGQEFDLTVTQSAPCPGSFTGTGAANLALTRITGSYSGSDCNGALTVDFVATK